MRIGRCDKCKTAKDFKNILFSINEAVNTPEQEIHLGDCTHKDGTKLKLFIKAVKE